MLWLFLYFFFVYCYWQKDEIFKKYFTKNRANTKWMKKKLFFLFVSLKSKMICKVIFQYPQIRLKAPQVFSFFIRLPHILSRNDFVDLVTLFNVHTSQWLWINTTKTNAIFGTTFCFFSFLTLNMLINDNFDWIVRMLKKKVFILYQRLLTACLPVWRLLLCYAMSCRACVPACLPIDCIVVVVVVVFCAFDLQTRMLVKDKNSNCKFLFNWISIFRFQFNAKETKIGQINAVR